MVGRDKTISDAELLYYFAVSDKPVLNVSRLQSEVEMTRQGIYSRLESLADDGYLDSMSVGASAKVWWLTDKGEQHVREEYYATSSNSDKE